MSGDRDGIADFASRYGLPVEALASLVSREVERLTSSTGASSSPGEAIDSGATFGAWALGEDASESRFEDQLSARHTYLGELGAGGMGVVRRVHDRDLNRVVAMKIIREEIQRDPRVVARFLHEAQATAQLEHPGIVPVYELGRLADGRLFFTMPEVRGRTLEEVIGALHRGVGDRWTLRKVVGVFHQVCEAVAYAHSRGVVHRDLKPSNVMVGRFGQVLVLDWGLAKLVGEAEDGVATEWESAGIHATRVGSVAGTPAYMPPEQARGEVERIDARSDVYALGAILYQLLSGSPPYARRQGDILEHVLSGPPEPLSTHSSTDGDPDAAVQALPLAMDAEWPEALVASCARAMSRAMEARQEDAEQLAREVSDWLDGATRRARGLELVAQARAKAPEASQLRERAVALRHDADACLAETHTHSPEADKVHGWRLQDEAAALERRAAVAALQSGHLLHGALAHAPDLAEAHRALAAEARAAFELAEAEGHDEEVLRAEVALANHIQALASRDPIRVGHEAYLRGDGAVTLVTDPPGASVELFRYERVDRRLVAVKQGELGLTPIHDRALSRGSYLAVLRAEGRAEVRYPFHIGREEHWDGVAPGQSDPTPVVLPRPDQLREDEVYIPAGWAWVGGDAHAAESMPRQRVWLDAYCIGRHMVNNGAYLRFLNHLCDAGREEEARIYAPSGDVQRVDELGEPVYVRGEDGRFRLPTADEQGDDWYPDYPVLSVGWAASMAFARWHAGQTGLPYRLPFELEWAKAGRGADGRHTPWGDFADECWACLKGSRDGPSLPAREHEFREDVTVYGVRHLAGNALEWCADRFVPGGPLIDAGRAVVVDDFDLVRARERLHVVRGCSWRLHAKWARLANRYGVSMLVRSSDVGFRVARPFGSLP